MILPKVRDPRFITIRRGGKLTDSDHYLLALWAADCAEHVLHLFESVKHLDARPRSAIEQARAWARYIHRTRARSHFLANKGGTQCPLDDLSIQDTGWRNWKY